MDARMGEVYWSTFHLRGQQGVDEGSPERVGTFASLLDAIQGRPSLAIGLGLTAYAQIPVSLGLAGQQCFADAEPHAQDVAQLALNDLMAGSPWLDAAAAQPVYVRDEVVKTQG
jgi:tRNA A37 threonylcarbamoyladenosine modification protein TsaB